MTVEKTIEPSEEDLRLAAEFSGLSVLGRWIEEIPKTLAL